MNNQTLDVIKYYSYHYDKRGSTTAIIQPDGTLIKGYTYDEFGNLAQSGASSFLNELTYTGSVSDMSSGLQYMNARYYQPSTGRFLTQDSYTGNPYDPWTQHLYSYCGNNPTNMTDPTGHEGVLDAYRYNVGMEVNGYWRSEDANKSSVVDNAMLLKEAEVLGSVSLSSGYNMPESKVIALENLTNADIHGGELIKGQYSSVHDEAKNFMDIVLESKHDIDFDMKSLNSEQLLALMQDKTNTSEVVKVLNAMSNVPGVKQSLTLLLMAAGDYIGSYCGTTTGSYWPSFDGFVNGTQKTITLQPGTWIDRYGGPSGFFASPGGTPAAMRSLSPTTNLTNYHVYRVMQPIQVTAGEVAPWFGQPGGGTQYMFSETIESLLNRGALW